MRKRATAFLLLLCSASAFAATNPPRSIPRAASSIAVDGNLSDAAWQTAAKYETWFETNPGDNVEPTVKTIGYVTYDDRFFYVAIESLDPDPKQIRAPYADHDGISGNADDFAGVILDTRNDGKSAIEFFVTARGTQYDAITNDFSGEDSSLDLFWDSAAKIHDKGWTMEARIPFSSLRYDSGDPQTWGLILYRNMPRERRYQIFTSRLPRDSSCFVCNYDKITDLRGLPSGSHFVAAPYVTARAIGEPRSGLGSEIVTRPVETDGGFDFKWTPTPDMALDATLNPDFSQVESDVAAISTNERFAIFFPEKRPFFLEGADLFSTPINAVYTRSITSPRWGVRSTGKLGRNAYTLLVAQDRGGGLTILPSPDGSNFADQDFSSTVFIGRVKRDFGRSYVSLLTTAREVSGGAHNRVLGPDFQWRINDQHTLTGQLLVSDTQTPDRSDLAGEWDGRNLRSHAAHIYYQFGNEKYDFFSEYRDFGDDFRADSGFVPQVGLRANYTEGGRTWRPKGFFNRVRAYAFGAYEQTQDSDLLYRLASFGFGADGKYRSFTRIRYARDGVRSGDQVFDRDRLYYTIQFAVNQTITQVGIDGWVGDEVDFSTNRPGKGANINVFGSLRPTNHLEIALNNTFRWLNLGGNRLFTSQVERIKATYTFNPRMFLRTIVQNERTNRDVALYGFGRQHEGDLATQLLFAYKLNWQTVMYIGVGDLQEVTADEGDFQASNRQVFAKVSYAFQR
jgi:hypothetical protein